MAQQLDDSDVRRKALMRDLQNRCEKIVELELSLNETREQYNNVLRNNNSKEQQKKVASLERCLEQTTNTQKQVSHTYYNQIILMNFGMKTLLIIYLPSACREKFIT